MNRLSPFNQFLVDMKLANKSQHTRNSYQRDLFAFLLYYRGEFLAEEIEEQRENEVSFLEAFNDWKGVPVEAIKGFVSYRLQQGISARTLARQLSAIRTFYQFLIEKGLAFSNPAKSIKPPKQPKPLPKSLDVDLTQKLLEQPLESWQDYRDQAIFEMLYSAGLRVAELAELDISPGLDQVADGWVRVIGKGNKERQAPIGSEAQKALNAWLKLRSEHAKPGEHAVFVNRYGRRLSVRSIQKALDERTRQAELPTKMSPHRLRHACATHVLESSGDLKAVQEMLGHANLSTTQIYTKLDMQHLANVYDNAHPRAKKSKSE